jgi:hypothetical protein
LRAHLMMCVGANVRPADRRRSVLFLIKNFEVAGRASGKLNDSTSYVRFSADVVEYFFGGASASVGYVIEALTDTFHGAGTGRNVEQALIGVGIVHDSRCFALHRKRHGHLLFLSCFMKSPERRRKVVKDWMSDE